MTCFCVLSLYANSLRYREDEVLGRKGKDRPAMRFNPLYSCSPSVKRIGDVWNVTGPARTTILAGIALMLSRADMTPIAVHAPHRRSKSPIAPIYGVDANARYTDNKVDRNFAFIFQEFANHPDFLRRHPMLDVRCAARNCSCRRRQAIIFTHR